MQLHRRPAWGIARSRTIACSRYTGGLRRHPLRVHASAASLAHLGSSFLSLDDHVVASPGPQLPGLSRKGPRPLPPPPTESSPAHVLPYLMGLMLGDWRLVCLSATSLLLVCTSKLAGLACPFFLKQAVDTLNAGPAAVNALPPLPFPLLPAGTPPVVQSALFAVACFGLCDVVKHICKEAQAPIFLPVTQAVARRITHHAFAHVLQLDVSFHMDKRTGRLSRILDRGPRGIQQIYRAAIFIFLPTTFELVAVCTVLARTFSPLVGGLVGVTFALYTAWSITLTQMATEVRKQVIELDNQVTSKVVDALLNFETVTLFNNQRLEVGQFYNGLKAYQGATGRTEQLAAMLNAGQALILALGMAAVMFAAVLVGRSGSGATAGDLVMIQGLLLQLWAPLQFLGWVYRELKNSLVDMTELVDILRTKSSIQDGTIQLPNVPSTTAPASGTAAAAAAAQGLVLDQHLPVASPVPSTSAVSSHTDRNGSGNGNGAAQQLAERREAALSAGTSGAIAASLSSQGLEIELRDVHFGYSSNRKILHGVSLRVGRGQSVAIVGPSGSGKSTVLKLLTRQYDINSGSVLLNGVEMRDLTLDSLRAAVAVVPQDTVLFNDSILQNIRYGRPEASDAEVLEAARMARLDVAVSKMPNGFETVVGERGLKLSGGEKQRVAIARAFLRSPRLLICDEATSALDTETEAQIIESLDTLAQGRTSIFVAHRLSTVRKCDKIIVLQDGVVAEEGSHVELMEREDGLYKTMWERQVAEEGQERGGGPPMDVTKSASSDDEDKDVTLLLPGESKEGIALSGMRSVLWMADESNGKGVLVAVPKQ